MKTKKLTLLSLLSALALVLGFMENMLLPDIPFLPVGAKPGLSNIVTMFTASLYGFSGAVYITLIKGLFALFTRGATAAVMSLCGGILSTAVMCFMIKKEWKSLSYIGIGVLSATVHNFGQLFAACFITGTASLLSYGKYLLLFGLVTGFVTGTVLEVSMPKIKVTLNQILKKRRNENEQKA